MARRERTRAQKALRVLLVLFLLTLMGLAGYSQYVSSVSTTGEKTTFLPEKVIVSVVAPIQKFFSSATDYVVNYMARVKLRANIEQAYNEVVALNDQLQFRALLAEELQYNNDYLRSLLGEYNTRIPMNPLHARVINREPGNWFSSFMLDKGSNDGVKPNMAVITGKGLVGNVVEVSPDQCKVLTIIDTNFSIAALLESSRDQGIIRGTLGVDGQPLCRMYYLPTNSVPRHGDTVSTSGVGLAFPRGLPIGKVRETSRQMQENKHYIVVEPSADFQHIEDVLILRYAPAAAERPEGEEDTQQVIQAPPTPRPQPTFRDMTNVTPAPIPDAPGRATSAPNPNQIYTPTPPPLMQYDEDGEPLTEEEYRMRQEFLSQ